MAKLPEDTRLETEKLIEDGMITQKPRPYLGLSTIGEKCLRKLWYGFRLCANKKISRRLERLFQRGHREEPIIQADLARIGVICLVDQNNQPEIVCGHGHIKGHVDDILLNVPDAPKTKHLGEYKTHNDKSFKDLLKKGLATSKPVHYAQMVTYMHKMKLTRGLYVSVNKNDDNRYYERISENPELAEDLLKKGEHVVSTETPPKRIGGPTWFECKWCDFYSVCHLQAKPLVNCRTCKFCDIEDDGKWSCSGHKINLAFDQQLHGCGRHKFMKGLL